MAEQNNEFMTAAATANGGEFALLETGAYSAVCVGLTKKEFKKYQSTETEPKFQFVFQVNDGDVNHYLRTLPFRNVINEKSNLFQFLNAWLGVSLEKAADGIDLGKTVGLKAQIVVDVAEREGKQYNVISNVLKAKKNDNVEFVKDDKAPAWLAKGPFIAEHWIDGLSFAEPKEDKVEFTDDDLVKEAEAKKPSEPKKVAAKEFLNQKPEGADEDESLPF